MPTSLNPQAAASPTDARPMPSRSGPPLAVPIVGSVSSARDPPLLLVPLQFLSSFSRLSFFSGLVFHPEKNYRGYLVSLFASLVIDL